MKTSRIAKILLFILLYVCMSMITLVVMLPIEDQNIRFLFSQLGMWLFPALLYMGLMYRRDSLERMQLKVCGWKDMVYFLLFYMLLLPFIDFLHEANQSISFPEQWSSLEAQFREMEEGAEESLKEVLVQLKQGKFFLILLIMAVLPAVCEEFFFRGVILSELVSGRVNKHIAVWVVGFLFSAVHFQFYGLFPRWLLGALLGYAFVYSRTIWLPIGLHFLNNASVVCAYYAYAKGWTSFDPELDSLSLPLWLTILCAALAIVVFVRLIFSRNRARSSSE